MSLFYLFYHFVNLITSQLDIRKIAIQTELETKPRYTEGFSNPHPLVITSLIDCVAAVHGRYIESFRRNVGIPTKIRVKIKKEIQNLGLTKLLNFPLEIN